MKTLNFVSLYLLAILFVSSCAVNVRMPANRLDSPETTGGPGKMKLEVGDLGVNQFTLTPDYSQIAPTTSTPSYAVDDKYFGNLGIGILDRLDITYRLPGTLQLKYQFLGASRADAKAGNFSLALTAAGGTSSESDSGVSFLSTQQPSLKLSEKLYDAALILGYRFSEIVMLYGGPFYTYDGFHGSYVTDTSSGSYSGHATAKGANLGLEIGWSKLFVRAEGAVTDAKLGSTIRDRAFLGALIGAMF